MNLDDIEERLELARPQKRDCEDEIGRVRDVLFLEPLTEWERDLFLLQLKALEAYAEATSCLIRQEERLRDEMLEKKENK